MARTQAMLWATMVGYTRALGFGAIGYLLFDQGRTGRAIAMLQWGFSEEIVNLYAEMGYGLHDPVLRVVMATGRPWAFSEVLARAKLTSGEQRHKAIVNEYEGAQDGIAFPLFGPNGRDAYAVLGQPRALDLLREIDRTSLHMAAQAAHLKALRLRAPLGVAGSGLSAREVEILRWVARGKSNSVIAEIMGISPGTVDTYLRRIFEKLGVGDRTAAAVKGVSLGLIRA